jgi:hypothetical protein
VTSSNTLEAAGRAAAAERHVAGRGVAMDDAAAWKNLAPQRDKAQRQIRQYAVEATN